jgi:DNA-binding CsgD family transcriptional regulator
MTATALRALRPVDNSIEPITIGLAPASEDRDWRAIAVAVRGLRGASTVGQLFGLVPAELCRCGFTRAWLSQVDGTSYRPVGFHAANEHVPRPSRRLERIEPGSLVHGTHEAEVVRRRRVLLVPDAGDTDPARLADPLTAELFSPRSYVVAPLVVDTRVVALLHADRPRSTLPLDDYDRDVVDVFAEAVGQALQRVILGERLEKLRVDVRALTNSVGDLVDDRCDEPLGLARRSAAEEAGAARPHVAPAGRGSRLAGLLTSRELEVLRLMATGETNAGIANALVISQGTVKSHVKNVLRKLHATNRAQAVSRYFRLVRADGDR